MKTQEKAYPIEFVGYREIRVVAITQRLDDGSTQTVVLTIEQLKRLTARALAETDGANA